MLGFKGLEIKNDLICSPSYPAVWADGKLSADPDKIREDNMAGIHIAGRISEAIEYSPHIFVVRGYGKAAIHDYGGRFEHAEIVAYLDLGNDIPEIVKGMNIPVILPTDLVEFGIGHPKVDADRNVIVEGKNLIALGAPDVPIRTRPEDDIRNIYIVGVRNEVYLESGRRIHVERNGRVRHFNVLVDDALIFIRGDVYGIHAVSRDVRIYAHGTSVDYMHLRGANDRIGTLGVVGHSMKIGEIDLCRAWIPQILLEASTVDNIEIRMSMVDVFKILRGSSIGSIRLSRSRVDDLEIQRADVGKIVLASSMVGKYDTYRAAVGEIIVDNKGGLA